MKSNSGFPLADRRGTTAPDRRSTGKGIHGIAIILSIRRTNSDANAFSPNTRVTQDSDAPDGNRSCYIGTDNVAAGRQAGELLKEALPQGGKIMVFVGVLDAANAQQRYQGLKEALAGSNV